MNRRRLLKSAAAAALVPGLAPQTFAAAAGNVAASNPHLSRVRPRDPAWPAKADWEHLKSEVGGRLIEVQWPLRPCRDDPAGL
jgi:hypothetical protein